MEGIEGSGKSTQAKLLSKWLDEQKIGHLLTKEPGSILSKTCQQIREIILNPKNEITPRAEFFLYLADRAQHVEKCIMPALKSGQWVISDRYSDSTYVYQGYGRKLGIDSEEMFSIMDHANFNITPDLTIVLDLPVSLGLKRARETNKEFVGGDRIENEDFKFFEKIRSGFLQVSALNPSRCHTLNAEGTIESLHSEIIEIVKEHKLYRSFIENRHE